MKKTLILLLVLILTTSLSLNAFGNESESRSWYIKRNGNKRPLLDEEQKIIYKHNGYYIDEKLNDDSNEKRLYLTFDLGYSNENTLKIIDVLAKHNIPAAFFVLDNIILKNADLVTRMINNGHLICNHSKNHKNLSSASASMIKEDLISLEKLFNDNIGCEMSKYFRFPEGRYSPYSIKTVSELGYKTIFWSFAYEDWDNEKQMPPEKAFKKVIDNTHNGAVMLFHPTSKTNADIFERLIIQWKSMGYEFGTLDDLTK